MRKLVRDCTAAARSFQKAFGAELRERVVERGASRARLPDRRKGYTQKAIDFVKAHRDGPFFVYLPHSMPHIPLYVPDDVRDPDPTNAYINTIEHIDAEVGRLLDVIDELKLADNTYVIYTTDNGPWLSFKHHGGSAGPLRDGKGSCYEAGSRTPCIVRWPGQVAPGAVSDHVSAFWDFMPTLADIAGATRPLETDGLSMVPVLTGDAAAQPIHERLYWEYHGGQALVSGRWKAVRHGPGQPLELYDLEVDLSEENDVAAERLMEKDAVMERAESARDNGSTRFCMGAAWREVREGPEFEQVLDNIPALEVPQDSDPSAEWWSWAIGVGGKPRSRV